MKKIPPGGGIILVSLPSAAFYSDRGLQGSPPDLMASYMDPDVALFATKKQAKEQAIDWGLTTWRYGMVHEGVLYRHKPKCGWIPWADVVELEGSGGTVTFGSNGQD